MVLAAGPGRRMGLSVPKLLLPVRGKPVLTWVLELVERLPLSERVLVLGAHAEEILAALFSFPDRNPPPPLREEMVGVRGNMVWRILWNPDWPEGMASSLRRAVKFVPTGMLVFLGDMPFVPEEAALAVLARAGEEPVAPSFRGQRGFPVYLPPSLRPALLNLKGDVGARDLLGHCLLVPWDDPGVVRDVDRPEDLGGEVWRGCGPFPQ
ncbi:MAG: nucleotidyltransferase family protein [Candidatus Bipolaricaulaceae bacterium]